MKLCATNCGALYSTDLGSLIVDLEGLLKEGWKLAGPIQMVYAGGYTYLATVIK
jgi:hypothetical protein